MSRFLWVPLSNLFFPEFDSTSEAVGTFFWLVVIGLVCSFLLASIFLRFLDEDDERPFAIGVEARIKISWAMAYGVMAVIVGTYTCIVGGVIGLRELRWGGLWLLWPHIVASLLFAFFSHLSIRGLERRTQP